MKRIFLSGPVTNKLNNNSGAFSDACTILRAAGHIVFSPPEIILGYDCSDFTHIDYCRVTAKVLIAEADVCVMLDGWQNSKGCAIEKAAAELFKIPVISIDDFLKQQADENNS